MVLVDNKLKERILIMCGECGCYRDWVDDIIERAEKADCFPSELPEWDNKDDDEDD